MTRIDVERLALDERSWVDIARGFLPDAEEAFAAVHANVAWRQSRIFRYERWYDEPRLGGFWRVGDPPPHPALVEVHRVLQHHYGVRFTSPGLALYRDGRDGQAFHRDRDMRWLDDTLIGILTLGARRPWLLRSRADRYDHEGGAAFDLAPGPGDLIVLGGRCQADWEHSVPKVRHPVAPRISAQWRWTAKVGRPEVGASYRAPRHFSR